MFSVYSSVPVSKTVLYIHSHSFAGDQENMTLSESDTVKLSCVSSGAFPAANISWFKDIDSPNDTNDDIQIENAVTFTEGGVFKALKTASSILFYTVDRHDNGIRIYCEASNGVGSAVQSSFTPLINILCRYTLHTTLSNFFHSKVDGKIIILYVVFIIV